MQTHSEIRKAFLDFFQAKQHQVISSSKLFLPEDQTLLFVNAGMNQFKNIFIGNQQSPYKRVVNSQKCLRVSGKHNDLDDVGLDHYHHTLFEMLGSWSFADYYKAEAIEWSWELITDVYKLDKSKLWATVYETDQESAEIWKTKTDIDPTKVLFCGRKDNFWTMGSVGPCGPSSEIHYDLGPQSCDKQDQKHNCSVNGDCSRYIELWNLVFMEFEQKEDGSEIPLENKYVDTGMGLERIVRVLQNKDSNYDTDIFTPIFIKIEEISGILYKTANNESQIAFRVIADHIRTLCFAIADGVYPSNTGRGYVVRRILRRAYRYGKNLQMPNVFLAKIAPTVIDIMGDHFTELKSAKNEIIKTITEEEERFAQTLEIGLNMFEKELKKQQGKIISGTLAFLLFDTFGFPLDLTALLAKEKGYVVDINAFEQELEKQKKLSKENQKFKDSKTTDGFTTVIENIHHTEFTGYDSYVGQNARIVKYQQDGNRIQIVLDKTPFYAEGGGQIADIGTIFSPHFIIYVEDVQKTPKEFIHYGTIEGQFHPQDNVSTSIDKDRRDALTKHHSGVHILNKVLTKVLARDIEFNSTYVAEDYFYCDIPSSRKLTEEEITQIEEEMNRIIQNCIPSITHLHHSLEEATNQGISSRFEDRLTDKDITRVVEFSGITTDLCGGTHVKNTGELGVFKILSDTSSGSNLRHIECVCGLKAWKILATIYEESRELSYEFKTSVREVPRKSLELLEENKTIKKELKNLKIQLAQYKFTIDDAKLVGQLENKDLYFAYYKDATMGDIKRLSMEFSQKKSESLVLLVAQGIPSTYIFGCSEDLSKQVDMAGLHKQLLAILNAKGGGKGSVFSGSLIGEIHKEHIINAINKL